MCLFYKRENNICFTINKLMNNAKLCHIIAKYYRKINSKLHFSITESNSDFQQVTNWITTKFSTLSTDFSTAIQILFHPFHRVFNNNCEKILLQRVYLNQNCQY